MKSPSQDLRSLLNTFNAASLGQGDLDAGTNLLAAMAVTLANVSRPGSGIASPGLGRMRSGASLLVSGGLGSSLVTDYVVTELTIRQNNLTAHLRRLFSDKVADAEKGGPRAVEFPAGAAANFAENALFQLEQRNPLVPIDPLEKWSEVVISPPNPRIDDLAARPRVVICASSAATLRGQLTGLHDGRPLVVLGLHSAAEATNLSDTCNALLSGSLANGKVGEIASGNLLVTDQMGVLPDIADTLGGKGSWLSRSLWLVDDAPGVEAVLDKPRRIRLENEAGRFGSAPLAGFRG